jgi:hypothetical protein
MHVRSVLAIALFASAAGSPIAAQPAAVYTDRASWEAAATGLTTVGFEGIVPASTWVYYPEIALAGVTFEGSFGYTAVVGDLVQYPSYDWGSGATLQGPSLAGCCGASGPGARLRITLPPGTTAFGTDVMVVAHPAVPASGVPLIVTLSSGETFTAYTVVRPGRAFVGFTAGTPVSYVDVAPSPAVPAAYPSLDNVSVGQKGTTGPVLTSLTLKKPIVAGCKPVTGTVTLSAPAPAGGAVVTLGETLASGSVPASVTIPAGATSKTFKVTTTARADSEAGTVSATYGGTTLTKSLTVRPMSVLSIPITPATLVGGGISSGVVKLECKAGPGPILVEFGSTLPAVASTLVPNVLIPAGVQTAPVTVTTSPVTATKKPKITATANGLTKSKTLTVTP